MLGSNAKVKVPFLGLEFYHSPSNLYLCLMLLIVPVPFALPYFSYPSNSERVSRNLIFAGPEGSPFWKTPLNNSLDGS